MRQYEIPANKLWQKSANFEQKLANVAKRWQLLTERCQYVGENTIILGNLSL